MIRAFRVSRFWARKKLDASRTRDGCNPSSEFLLLSLTLPITLCGGPLRLLLPGRQLVHRPRTYYITSF